MAKDHSLLEILAGWSSGPGPRYARLHAAIDAAITRGELLPGASLPPERTLARALKLSRTTVVQAYQDLRQAVASTAVRAVAPGCAARHRICGPVHKSTT